MTTDKTLDEIMQFDHVICVHDDGSITDEHGIHAPDLFNGKLDSDRWEFFSTGYTGQDSYSGPIMHNSEFIGGRLEQDIRETPGVYVAIVSCYSDVCSECHETIYRTADDDGGLHHENGDYDLDHDAADDETFVEGWAVVRLKEERA